MKILNAVWNGIKTIYKNKVSRAWGIVTPILVALFTTVTILAMTLFNPLLQTVLGGRIPIKDPSIEPIYQSDYKSKKESKEAGDALNVKIASEGFVLLVNEGGLPIPTPVSNPSVTRKPKVSVFGKNSVNLVLGGSGSGGISGEAAKTIFDGLEQAGYEYNPTLKAFYEDNSQSGPGRSSNPETKDATSQSPTLETGETPQSLYTAKVRASYKDYDDAAIVVISRIGGESFDLPRTQKNDSSKHYLQLDEHEYALLDAVTNGSFKKVIVILNTIQAFQCDFIEQYNNSETPRIHAVLWIGGPGSTGALAIGDVLSGKANPSGRTVDIYPRDFTKDPTWQNFGDYSQITGIPNSATYLENNSPVSTRHMIVYDEGIYLGYRYYETRGMVEGGTWYWDNVIFPFGYGLSYTTFTQQIVKVSGGLKDANSKVTIEVKVKNTGSVAGKDVVQLYVSTPYYYGGIEKPFVQLVEFAKSPLLRPNEEWTVSLTVDAYDLASYDYNDANFNNFYGYELEKGDYTFYISKSSHVEDHAYDYRTFNLDTDLRFENDPVTGTPVVNRYSQASDDTNAQPGTAEYYLDSAYRLDDNTIQTSQGHAIRKGMSRTDFEATFPRSLTREERNFKSGELDYLASKAHNNTDIAQEAEEKGMPKTNTDDPVIIETDENGNEIKRNVMLRDLIGLSYDDPLWEKLLDRLSPTEMLNLVNKGAFQTEPILKIGKNLTNDSDGPIGFVNFMPGSMQSHYYGTTTFASEILIASTWNKDLAYQMGKIVGDNGLWGDENGNGLPYTGWYAPAVNLHRSPFSGRNFEYYSEDPILSGKMAVQVINGAATKGVYTDLKHFALNDQETNRAGVATFATEQAIRELYLKPFELAVKGDDVICETAAEDGIEEYQGTKGMMSSFNRIGLKWTGGDYRLLTEILRKEWGFRGLVICDYKTDNFYMDSKQMLYAGNDLILASLRDLFWNNCNFDSVEDMLVLRKATHNILYAVANSNSMNVNIIGYYMPWWQILLIVVDCVLFVGLTVWGVFAIRKAFKQAKAK